MAYNPNRGFGRIEGEVIAPRSQGWAWVDARRGEEVRPCGKPSS